jgi:putative glutathione S-transferase
MRKLKGLEHAVTLSILDPHLGSDGWRFSDRPGATPDLIGDARLLRDVYRWAVPGYTGPVSVPVLWDRETRTIVSNESRDIMRMLDVAFDAHATASISFAPPDERGRIDQVIDALRGPINNGVYRCGFARTQAVYDRAVTELFDALFHWEEVLRNQPYLCGERITEADWCLFTTLYRFDPVYASHFKCNVRRIADIPVLWAYLKDLYRVPGVATTCDLEHVKAHYYGSVEAVSSRPIIPKGPVYDLG